MAPPMQLPPGLTGDTGGGSKHGQPATHQQLPDFGQAECLTLGVKESTQDERADTDDPVDTVDSERKSIMW